MEYQNKIGATLDHASLKKSHTSSIQNFFMLVENGDIPQPENGVLTEPLMKRKQPGPGGPEQTAAAEGATAPPPASSLQSKTE